MKKFVLTLIPVIAFFMFLSSNLSASDDISKAMNILKERGEVYFRFKNTGPNLIKTVKIISIDSKTDSEWIYAYANEKEFEKFVGQDIQFELLTAPGLLYEPVMRDKVDILSGKDWDYYPSYEAYVNLMYQFEDEYPGLCKIVNIGTTVEGMQLLFAKITSGVNKDEPKPRFMYTSSIHGDETGGYVLMLHLIDSLLQGYGSSDGITALLNGAEIWINPLANPDGTYAGGNNTVYGAKRYNGNNIDLNRNYPDPEDGPHPDGNEWQPETKAFMHLADSLQFTMSANLHAGAEVCNYPWDTWAKLHADDDWWQFVCREYADTVHANSPAGYLDDLNNGITNGYAWYTISGGRQDYMNYFAGCREFTLELSNVKLLPANMLPLYWGYNAKSFLNYIKQVTYGFSGTVRDMKTGEPVEAMLTLTGHDMDSSMVFSGAQTGYYYRPVYQGTYNLLFSAAGYKSKQIDDVVISNYETIIINVELEKEGSSVGETELKELFVISPNPVRENIFIEYNGNKTLDIEIKLYSLKGDVYYSGSKTFTPSPGIKKLGVTGLPAGVYFLKLSAGGDFVTEKLIIE